MKERRPGNFILISGLVQTCELPVTMASAQSCVTVSRGRGPFVPLVRDGRERSACGWLSVIWYPHHVGRKL